MPTTISPNMGMPVPVVSQDPGVDYATNVNASLSIIDSHNHSNGQGVPINPAGIDINSDLSFASNNATIVRSVNFSVQPSPLALPTDIGCIYVSGEDLYYNDESGNVVRITQGGAVSGSAGTITGLPSGTASASYAAGTFTFQSATSTPAALNVGPLTIAQNVASSKTVTINTNAAQGANYSVTMPTALPSTVNYMTLDNTGAISYNPNGVTGTGAVALSISPTFTGTVTVGTGGIGFTSGTMVDYVEGTWAPTLTPLSGTVTMAVSGTARYQRIGNVVYCRMQMLSGGANPGGVLTISLPIAPTNNFSASSEAQGFTSIQTGANGILATTGAKTVQTVANVAGPGTTYIVFFIYYLNN